VTVTAHNKGQKLGRWFGRSVALSAAFLLTACFQNEETPPLKIGLPDEAGSYVFYLAESARYFSPNDAHLVHLPPSIDKEYALENGLIDAVSVPLSTAMAWQSKGLDISILLVTSTSLGRDVALSSATSEQLRGLDTIRIGVDRDCEDQFLSHRFREERLSANQSLEFTYMSDEDAIRALSAGAIDIAVIEGEKPPKNSYNTVFTSADIPGELVDVLVVRSDKIMQHEQHIERIIVGWRTARETFGDRFDSATLPRFSQSLDLMQASLDGVSLATINRNLGLMAQNGRAFKEMMLRRASLENANATVTNTALPELEGRFLFSDDRSKE